MCSLKEAGFSGRHRCGVTLLSGKTLGFKNQRNHIMINYGMILVIWRSANSWFILIVVHPPCPERNQKQLAEGNVWKRDLKIVSNGIFNTQDWLFPILVKRFGPTLQISRPLQSPYWTAKPLSNQAALKPQWGQTQFVSSLAIVVWYHVSPSWCFERLRTLTS